MDVRQTKILIGSIFLLTISCSRNPEPLQEIPIGSPEKTWRDRVKNMIDSKRVSVIDEYDILDTTLLYEWKLSDTSFIVGLRLNSDGIDAGSLRSKTIVLSMSINEMPNSQKTDSSLLTFKGIRSTIPL